MTIRLVAASNMSRTLICKLLQKKAYDMLSKKHTLLIFCFGLIILFVAVLHFGETMLDWSKEKYTAVFSPYSTNIVGRNFRSMLCQYVPIDVVYTWVNGSDPKFLKELFKAKEDYGFLNAHLNCTYSHCVPSHMVLVRPSIPSTITLGDLEESDPVFEHLERIFMVSSSQGIHENITVLVFPSILLAQNVVLKKFLSLDGQNYTFSTAYITDNWNVPSSVLLSDVLFLSDVPSSFSSAEIKEKFPDVIKSFIDNVFVFEEKSLAILSVRDSTVLHEAKKLNITFNNKLPSLSAAYLVVELPSSHEDVSSSRFTDNEELRYSLRSLEKHAPWVQHVYIITNGQIPYWLNLDNPWVSVVTHEEIFPNKSHLPTFSSPAIECHIHRIPNLSGKFLYLNDDVMFGKDVWPEDFYTHTKGQKIYLSWPVPNCAEGCPSSWIRDGYCDKPCNNSQCQWDGGDCTADNPMLAFSNAGLQLDSAATSVLTMRIHKNYCNEDCANTWLADRYCDRACNLRVCGYDAGDCGTANFHDMPQLVLKANQTFYSLPEGEHVGYFNLTDFLNSNYSINDGYYEENPSVRTIAISLKYSVIGIVLYPNHNATNITMRLRGTFNNVPSEKILNLRVCTISKSKARTDVNKTSIMNENVTEESFTFEEFSDNAKSPKILPLKPSEDSLIGYENVNVSASELPSNISKLVQDLKRDLDAGIITSKGFLKKKQEIIGAYLKNFNATKKFPLIVYEEKPIDLPSSDLKISNNSTIQNTTNVGTSMGMLVKSKMKFKSLLAPKVNKLKLLDESLHPQKEELLRRVHEVVHPAAESTQASSTEASALRRYFKSLKKSSLVKSSNYSMPLPLSPSVTQRHLLDTFGDSLRHVNKLYNEAFGFEARKVPSHIAHFVDKHVMDRLTKRFNNAFDVTSSHKIRSSNDMQFAFSYYYYLMSEVETIEVGEIFDMFDTDKTGTWSDREIRTVLTRLHDLPLDFSSVTEFEQKINNCSQFIDSPITSAYVPTNERYYDSKLPLVTKQLVCKCPPVASTLLEHFGQRKRNYFEILGEDEVAFKMIHNNLSQVLGQIDDLRKNPKKFICLNDNMNHGTQEAEIIRAVIQDFYESLFPLRSSFELSPEYRNRFLYVSELKEWRKIRDIIRIVTYSTLSLLIIFSVISFWKTEMRSRNSSARNRSRQNRSRNRNPLSV